jgi:hypothetical protein
MSKKCVNIVVILFWLFWLFCIFCIVILLCKIKQRHHNQHHNEGFTPKINSFYNMNRRNMRKFIEGNVVFDSKTYSKKLLGVLDRFW